MATQFNEWLSLAASEGRGGASARPPSIVRGFDRSFVLNLSSHPDYGDWTVGSFSSSIKASPDASTALATWDISVGLPASGVTPLTFTLASDDQGSLTADGDGNGLVDFVMQINFTPSGGVPDPIIQTFVTVTGAA